MGKTRISDPIVRTRDVKDALGDAFTRAIFKTPPSLLREFVGAKQVYACRRLAIRVTDELAGDGWRERRARLDLPGLDEVLVTGMRRAGNPILGTLAGASVCCNQKLLDNIAQHLGEVVFREMQRKDVALEQGAAPTRR